MPKADPVYTTPLAQAQAMMSRFAERGHPAAEDHPATPARLHITIPLHFRTDFVTEFPEVQGESAEAAETATSVGKAEATDSIGPGTVLGGRYLLGKVLGTGGMCTVFEGLDRQLVSQGVAGAVAVKIINPRFRQSAVSVLGLQREFECLMKLQHPGVVRVFDLSNEHGTWFFTMELLSGETLARRLRADLGSQEALRVLLQCAEALAYAHQHGVVHGDLKPENVFLTREGARLLDFGSAWRQHEIVRRDRVSATPAYASSQVLQGSVAEPRDDLYSLGCVAYELFTGRHPFDGLSSLEAEKSKLRPVWFPRMPARYFSSIARMLAWEREDRPHSVQEFLDSLAAADTRYSGSLTVKLRPISAGKAAAAGSNSPVQPVDAVAVAAEPTQSGPYAATNQGVGDKAASTEATRVGKPSSHFVNTTSSVRRASDDAARAFAAFSGGRPGIRRTRTAAFEQTFETSPVPPPEQRPDPSVTPPSQTQASTPSSVVEPAVESRTVEPESVAAESASADESTIAESEAESAFGASVSEARPTSASAIPESVPEPSAASNLAAGRAIAEAEVEKAEQKAGSQSAGTAAPQPQSSREPARQVSTRRSLLRATVSHAAVLQQPLRWIWSVVLAVPQSARHVVQPVRVYSRNELSRLAAHPAFNPPRVIAAVAFLVLLLAVVLLLQQTMENRGVVQATAERIRLMEARRESLASRQISFIEPRIDDMAMPDLDPAQIEQPASVSAGAVSFKSARVYVAPGQQMAVISLSRERSTSGGARVGWRAVPLTAQPGVDFELPDTQVVRFNEGQSIRTLYIPIKRSPSSPTSAERRFRVQLQQLSGGLTPRGISQVEVVIAGSTAD